MKKALSAGALIFVITNSLTACSFIPKFSEPELGAAHGSMSGAHYDSEPAQAFDSIQFGSEVATLPPEAHRIVSRAAVYLLDNPDSKVTVEGHTDHAGAEDHNQMLSEMRAGSIVRALKSSGISADRITAIGYGESNPIADNGTVDGRRENRRVELFIE